MNRYFTLPASDFPLYDPSTDEPVKDSEGKPVSLTHQAVFRAVLQDPRLKGELDACDIYDLRKKLTGACGSLVELTEDEHKALMVCIRRPATATTQGATTVLSGGALCSPGVISLFRSVIDAKSEKPAPETVAA